jgi:hypothetical protein
MSRKMYIAMLEHFQRDLIDAISALEQQLPEEMGVEVTSFLGDKSVTFPAAGELWRVVDSLSDFVKSAKGE